MRTNDFKLTLGGKDITSRMSFYMEGQHRLVAEAAYGYAFTLCLCGAPPTVEPTIVKRVCACGRPWRWTGAGWQTDAREWPDGL